MEEEYISFRGQMVHGSPREMPCAKCITLLNPTRMNESLLWISCDDMPFGDAWWEVYPCG